MLKQAHDCFRDCVIYYKCTQIRIELAITVDVFVRQNIFFKEMDP